MTNTTDRDIEARKKKRQGIVIGVLLGTFVVLAIAAMTAIDYFYAAEPTSGRQRPHDAADR